LGPLATIFWNSMISLQISRTPERLSAFRDGIKQFSSPSDSLFPALSLCRDQGFTPMCGCYRLTAKECYIAEHCDRTVKWHG
jgi:hypothetical protein